MQQQQQQQQQPCLVKVRGCGSLRALEDNIVLKIFAFLTAKELLKCSAVSPVFYIYANEEELWRRLCLLKTKGDFLYKGSWKLTTLLKRDEPVTDRHRNLFIQGFSSYYLYTKWFRCNVDLSAFQLADKSREADAIDRISSSETSVEEFVAQYSSIGRPVIFTDIVDEDKWAARSEWTKEKLVEKYGDVRFKVQHLGAERNIRMRMRDYCEYTRLHHDEDPLYIFDSSFGERAPDLVNDYKVPKYFQEDYFTVLEGGRRPEYRWFVMGPARSGAPWHVDPATTSAWNTLLVGQKRWALYRPDTIPPGMRFYRNSKGKIKSECPSSLQWYLEVYPHLADADKPLEIVQQPGETIFVPSGWWHMVLNLTDTIAVTQNFCNDQNLESVAHDLLGSSSTRDEVYPQFRELLCAQKPHCASVFEKVEAERAKKMKAKKMKSHRKIKNKEEEPTNNKDASNNNNNNSDDSDSDSDDDDDDDYEMEKLLPSVRLVCERHGILVPPAPAPSATKMNDDDDDEDDDDVITPVPTGQNPVFIVNKNVVVKFYAEEFDGAAVYAKELQIYKILAANSYNNSSSSNNVVDFPALIAHGFLNNDTATATATATTTIIGGGEWNYPYIITSFVQGEPIQTVHDKLTQAEMLDVARFLGKALRHLHEIPVPLPPSNDPNNNNSSISSYSNNNSDDTSSDHDAFTELMKKQRRDCKANQWRWGHLTSAMINQLDSYLPQDVTSLFVQDRDHHHHRRCMLVHGDVTDENVLGSFDGDKEVPDDDDDDDGDIVMRDRKIGSDLKKTVKKNKKRSKRPRKMRRAWRARSIIDFGDTIIGGDPMYDLVAMHIAVFRCDKKLLRAFLESYGWIPTNNSNNSNSNSNNDDAIMIGPMTKERFAYVAMCYTLLHRSDALNTAFHHVPEAAKARTIKDLENLLWAF